MEKIYIKVNEKDEIIYKHQMVFDSKYGLNKSKEELMIDGYLVYPKKYPNTCPKGKTYIEKFNRITNEIYFDLVDIIKESGEAIEEKLIKLEKDNANIIYALMMGGLI